jgi:cytochrome P450
MGPSESQRRLVTAGAAAPPGAAVAVPGVAPPGASVAPPGAARVAPGPQELVAFDAHVDALEFLGGLVLRYGDVVRYRTRFGPCFLFVHPGHVQTILHRENYRRASLVKLMLGDGLLASDGPRWRSQRRLMQRDFQPKSIEPFAGAMTRETARTAAAWRAAAAAGAAVDVTEGMTLLTLRIVVDALFGHDLPDARAAELCGAITQTINDLGQISWTVFGVPVRLTPQRNASFAGGKGVIDAFCYELIARRRATPAADRPRDLLTLLVEADGEGGPMDDRQLRDELVTMLVGGHETTALALAWAWKLLAEHPDVEARLHAELDDALRGRAEPTTADVPRLAWTRAVFQEAMRLYPPVWYMARVANEDDVIDGYAVPRGACVLVSAWLTHRHAGSWREPGRFDPSRFLDGGDAGAAAPAHRYAYFPFGGGRHQCLGMHFALLEGTLILAQLAWQFRLRPVAGQDVRPDPGITLRQSPGMLATVERRAARAGAA